VSRNENEQETEKTNEIEVVRVELLVKEKTVGPSETKQHHAGSVTKSNGNKECQNPQHSPVNVKPLARPGADPGEPVIFEKKIWIEEKVPDPMVREIAPHLPYHQRSKGDSEKDERGNVDRREGALP
jgi:hypothetical protein